VSRVFDLLENYNGAITALATFAISIFTLVLVIVTRRQAILTKEAVRISERALISTERAFVFLDDFDPEIVYGRRGNQSGDFNNLTVNQLAIRPRWRNGGNTPTKDMTIIVNWTLWSGGLPVGFSYAYGENVVPAPMFLGPKATEWSEPIRIPANVATTALHGGESIFIWGRVEYRDIFDKTRLHFTEWCYKLVFVRVQPSPQTQFVAFGPHNRSDEDQRA
jgi:hypothetical protein